MAWLGYAIAFVVGCFLGAKYFAAKPTAPAPPADRDFDLQQALQNERERIYADLHDDLSGDLLQLIYNAPDPQQAATARQALRNLRAVVSRSRGSSMSLLEALGEIQQEAQQRLQAVGISLSWSQADIPEQQLRADQSLHLYRIVREALNNVIRHAQAQRLDIRIARHANALRIALTDDGAGLPRQHQEGSGSANMRARAAALQGDITWRGATAGGTRVVLSLPLEALA